MKNFNEAITENEVVAAGLGMLENTVSNKTNNEMGNDGMIKLYVANLGKYNEGELVGEWITLPISEDDLNEMYARIKLGSFDENGDYVHGFIEKDGNGYEYHYEEMAIHDYEAPFKISEYSNIEELNEIAERLESFDNDELNVIEAYLENVDNDLNRAIEMIENNEYSLYHNCNSMADVAMEYIEKIGSIKYAVTNVDFYLDYEAFQRDLELEGYFSEQEEEFGEEYSYEDKKQIAEEFLDDSPSEIKENYFDYEAYGRDMEIEGTFVYDGLGVYIEFHN